MTSEPTVFNQEQYAKDFWQMICQEYGRSQQAPVTTFCWCVSPLNMVTGFVDHELTGYRFASWSGNKTTTLSGKLDYEGAAEFITWLVDLCGVWPDNINDLNEVRDWLESDNLSDLQSTY